MAKTIGGIVFFLCVLVTTIQAMDQRSSTSNEEATASFDPRTASDPFIDANLIPVVTGFPRTDVRLTDRPDLQRFGARRIVPFGEDMVVPVEHLRKFTVHRFNDRGIDWGEVSVTDTTDRPDKADP